MTTLIQRDALLSPCGLYRYSLTRTWTDGLGVGTVLWVMLNPSNADALIDDRTIGRCTAFSRNWGFDGFAVGNCYGYRTPSPAVLKSSGYLIGSENDDHLKILAPGASLIVAAWGDKVQPRRAAEVLEILRNVGPVHALAFTKSGQPRHPLYLPGDALPIEWKAAA